MGVLRGYSIIYTVWAPTNAKPFTVKVLREMSFGLILSDLADVVFEDSVEAKHSSADGLRWHLLSLSANACTSLSTERLLLKAN